MHCPPTAVRSPPSGQTRQRWSARRCGGSVERARAARRRGRPRRRRRSRRSALVRLPTGWRPYPSSRRTSSRSRSRARVRSRGRSRVHRRDGRATGRPDARPAGGSWGYPMSAEREQGEVALRDDVGVVARPPELNERGIRQRRGLNPVDARVERKQSCSRHAVLQAGPRRSPKRLRPHRHPLLEPTDPPPERQNLPPGEPESRTRHELGTLGTSRPSRLGQRAGMSPDPLVPPSSLRSSEGFS